MTDSKYWIADKMAAVHVQIETVADDSAASCI